MDDGTFWMDLTHFVMGFSLVDVCFAYHGWHARSLPNAFPARACPWRVCRDVYRVKPHHAAGPVTLYLMSIQVPHPLPEGPARPPCASRGLPQLAMTPTARVEWGASVECASSG